MKKEHITPNPKTGEINIILNYLVCKNYYKESKIHLAIIPSLNLTAKSKQEIDLEDKLKVVLTKFLEFYKDDKLDVELKRCGWNGFDVPNMLTIPSFLLYGEFKIKQIELRFVPNKIQNKIIIPEVDPKYLATLHEGSEKHKKK